MRPVNYECKFLACHGSHRSRLHTENPLSESSAGFLRLGHEVAKPMVRVTQAALAFGMPLLLVDLFPSGSPGASGEGRAKQRQVQPCR